jgi:predicted membrane-bound spermidine synthase
VSPRKLVLAGLAFLASGLSALVYQVSWQRILALHSGIGIVSVALIVGSFMLGLGFGSHAGGLLSRRFAPRRALLAFALLESGVASFGLASPYVLYDLLYVKASWLYQTPWVAGLLHFLSLLFPTTLMGMSLPLLVRAAVHQVGTAGRVIGYLYGINVVGASLGALLTPWFLIRFLGIRGAISAAALLNVMAMGTALLLWSRTDPEAAAPAHTPPASDPSPKAHHPFILWMGLYALSGFCALSLEMVWFRIIDLGAKTMAFSFGTVLALFLVGNAVGSLGGAWVVTRIDRPLRAFLLCQAGLLSYAGLAIVVLVSLPPDAPYFRWFYDYWGQARVFDIGDRLFAMPALKLYALLPACLFGPPTILMGFSFPVLQRAVQTDPASSGRKVGLLQASNILGNVAGSLITGLLLFRWMGTTGTLRLLLVLGLVFVLVGFRREGRDRSLGLTGLTLGVLIASLPDQGTLWRRLHGVEGSGLVGEDETGVAAILPESPTRFRLFVNGKSHSWFPYGGIHSRLGAVPAVIHEAPRDVAVIGLGSGDTAWASALRAETRSVTVFEISGRQPELLEQLAGDESVAWRVRQGLRNLLDDPRVRIVTADGRQALQHSQARYDVIVVDALTPGMAYSGNLYSVEFFRLSRSRLKPGGILCAWSPTPRVYRSFRAAFPHALEVEERNILIGSNDFIKIDRRTWRDRVLSSSLVSYLGGAQFAQRILWALRSVRRLPSGIDQGNLNHDLFPRDEFRSR